VRIHTARKGWGSFLTFDGWTHPGSEASVHLWVYLCDWELGLGSECMLDSSETDASKFEATLIGLTGATLMSVTETQRGRLFLTFDTGYQLEMRSNTRE
jgi:hypothetical protein